MGRRCAERRRCARLTTSLAAFIVNRGTCPAVRAPAIESANRRVGYSVTAIRYSNGYRNEAQSIAEKFPGQRRARPRLLAAGFRPTTVGGKAPGGGRREN